jgi:hypothetical protein
MAEIHLTRERWAEILEGRFSPEERPLLLAHLEDPCEQCEQFLAEASERGEIDALDGLTDDALIGLSGPKEDALDELAFARIDRAVRIRRGRRLIRPLLALAAVLLVAVLVRRAPESSSHLKGPPTVRGAVRLQVLAARGGQIAPLAPDSAVGPEQALLFEVELARPTCIELLRTSSRRGTEQLLERPACLSAGKHVIEQGGHALGLPLRPEDQGELVITARAEGESAESASVRVIVAAPGAP